MAALHCEGKELQVSTAIEPFGSYITNLEREIIFEKYLLRCLLSPTARFSIIGITENPTSHKWGLRVSFKDYSSHEKKLEIPLSCIHAKNSSFFRNILCDGGYSCRKGFPPDVLFERIQQDLSWYPFVTCITKVGWQRAPEVYILPKRIYGTFDQSKYHFECSCSGYRNHGNLQEWGQIAETAVGNTRFVFALCAAFAAVLLTPLGIEGGGFNFVGESSSGKTTALKIASSVWGNDIISWNSTINALENIASEHNDNLLVLDELRRCTCWPMALAKTEAAETVNCRKKIPGVVCFFRAERSASWISSQKKKRPAMTGNVFASWTFLYVPT